MDLGGVAPKPITTVKSLILSIIFILVATAMSHYMATFINPMTHFPRRRGCLSTSAINYI